MLQLNESTSIVKSDAKPVRSHRQKNAFLAAKFAEWLEAQNYSEHTRRSYTKVVQDLIAFLGSKSLTEVEHMDIRLFLTHLAARGCSPQSLAQRVYAIRNFYDFLGLGGVMTSFPARLIRNRRLPKPLPRFLSEAEVTRLLRAAETPRDRAILEVFYATGCRVGELVKMRIEDVDFHNRTILVHGKGSKDRLVIFGKKAATVLHNYLGDRLSGWLFLGEGSNSAGEDRPLTPRHLWRVVSSAGLRAGLGRVHPHVLRHTFATHLLSNGADLRAVQELLGHSSVATTQIYLHCTTQDLARTIKRCHPRWR